MAVKRTKRSFRNITTQRKGLTSRLNLFNILQESADNVYFNNIFRAFTMADNIKGNNVYFDVYLAEENDWWDNISFKYYGTEVLWYLVCEMNDVVNPFEDLVFGQQVKVLKEGYLYNVYRNLIDISNL